MALLPKTLIAAALAALSAAVAAAGDKTPKSFRGVRLQFLPPPMDGAISMGIYDAAGNLVRVLHRFESVDSPRFEKALNGLVTIWDGTDNAGEPLPPGKYSARGYSVGDLVVEGLEILANDWAEHAETAPATKITGIAWEPAPEGAGERFVVTFETAVGNGAAAITPGGEISTAAQEAAVVASPFAQADSPAPPHATGLNGTAWAIEHAEAGPVVVQRAPSGELLRALAPEPGGPPPVAIAASLLSETIAVLSRDAREQLVRVLRLSGTAVDGISTWEETFRRSIRAAPDAAAVADLLRFPDGSPFLPQERMQISLRYNEMEGNRPGSVEVEIVAEESGAVLRASDGLPLAQLTERSGILWVAAAKVPGAKSVLFFESDGVVVEAFLVRKPANMMAFDLGDFHFIRQP